MSELFGIPSGALATALVVALAASLGAVALLALRNPIFARLGLRNIPRRRGRSALIVAGLMLGTAIVAAALATGDTMSSTIRSSVVHSLGPTDELVSVKGTEVESIAIAEAPQVAYIDESAYERVRETAARSPLVDAVAPAIIETVALQDQTSSQNEPRVTLFASDPAALADFAPIRAAGEAVSLADLEPGQVYMNAEAADELGARGGDRLLLLAGESSAPLSVRAVVDFDGAGTDGAAVLAPLATAQKLLGKPGQIEHVLVSNRGDAASGVKVSDEVVDLLAPTLAPLGLEVDPEKQEGLEIADEQGNAFMTIFTTFGTFSIAAGILLIFLIFVMLAAERRGELGIARAIGTRRGHLVQTYVFEGLAYDLAAALVGTLLGVGVAYGMVLLMARALGSLGIEIHYGVELRSIVIAYALGVLLTFVVVTLSAWRVSVLNIASAVRNLPDPLLRRRRRRWIAPVIGMLVGVLLTISGVSAADGLSFLLGVSIVLVSLASIARMLGAPDRLAYTAAGLAIVAFWLLPFDALDFIADFAFGYGVFLASGLAIVVGATWVIVYNAELLLGALAWTVGRIRSLAPVLRLAIAYPLRNLFRTGVTLAMFTLVVFTLVVGTTVSGSFTKAMDDVERYGGGFDIRAVASPASPIGDAATEVPRAAGAVRVTASQSIVPLDARQARTGRPFESYPVTGLDDVFLANTTYGLAAVADGYRSAEDVWRAVASRPGLAVVDAFVAPRRDNYNLGVVPDFRVSGFYLEDGRFTPVPVDVRDPQTGRTLRLTVIGVLNDAIPESLIGISTSQSTLSKALGERAHPTVYWLGLRDNAEPHAIAAEIESAFLANGLEAEPLEETLEDATASSQTFNYIVLGFMGLGLIVGVAALGVITARSVVERRQQIGVLRSIGFQRRMIQAAFLLESSFVALSAILVGSVLGLALGYNIIADTAKQPSWDTLSLTVPWLTLSVVFLLVYAVALLTTLAPAVRASRVYPAEALRYQ